MWGPLMWATTVVDCLLIYWPLCGRIGEGDGGRGGEAEIK